MASASADKAQSQKRPLTVLDLPAEAQSEIISHCSQGDLICLSLVSKHFRELAAAQLYRNFHIVFPDEDDPSYDSPIDGLAGGLDTFVTSDYDYAQHLKDLSLDTLSTGGKAEVAYKPYLYNVSCGKFMNTLLLLALRKARTLETFRWNIRVELSRPVYKALHQINTLSHVHIRLQSGPSLYETPPSLPFVPPVTVNLMPTSHFPGELTAPLPPPPAFAMPPPPSMFYTPPISAPPPPLPKAPTRTKIPKKTSMSKEPPTLSGFKDLKSLSVLDIDSLDIITEVKSCVRNSCGTLTKLRLSFSETLALQARKPPPDLDPDDSDPDDEFQIPVASNPNSGFLDDVGGPAKAFRALEERKSQETILGRIFDVEPYFVKKPKKRSTLKDKEPQEESVPDPGKDFVNALRAVSGKLIKDLSGGGPLTQKQQETLDMIESAAKMYVESKNTKNEDGVQNGEVDENQASSSSSTAAKTEEDKQVPDQQASEEELFAPKPEKAKETDKDVITPEDINIEEPEEQLLLDLSDGTGSKDAQSVEAVAESDPVEEEPASKTPAPQTNGALIPPNIRKAMDNLTAQKENFKTLADKLESFESQATSLNKEILELRGIDGPLDQARILDAEKRMHTFTDNIRDIQREMHMVEAEIDDAEKQIPSVSDQSKPDEPGSLSRRVSDYVRATRGFALKTLSIYLIPVKASVLSKAVDLRVLRSVTLLNVGHQEPIWALFAKENKVEPLAIRKIFTDNVSKQFLDFVSQLDELHELFMLERDTKYKPESFATKTLTTIEQIRRVVLRKHIPKLKRLMIKNLSGVDWDLNVKTTLLIARKGRNLEELAVSMNIRAVHFLMQQLSGLINLRALHIIQLRNDDTCVWVMRETKKFLVDNLSHFPKLKLEWLSIDDDHAAEHIVRPLQAPKTTKKKSKGKEKATALPNGTANGVFPLLPLDAWDNVEESDDDDEDEEDFITFLPGTVHFSDVWGVKIFKKEITSGRL